MKKYVYEDRDDLKSKLIEVVNAEPECGEDFCDSCGDCLHCYGGDECLENEDGEHIWIEYRKVKEVSANDPHTHD